MCHGHTVEPAPRDMLGDTATGTFTVTAAHTHATVQVQGDMDVANAELLAAVLDNQLIAGRRFVRLDLTRLTFLDCAGLRVLVHAHKAFRADPGGMLLLTGVGARIARLLEITHLDEALFVAGQPARLSN